MANVVDPTKHDTERTRIEPTVLNFHHCQLIAQVITPSNCSLSLNLYC